MVEVSQLKKVDCILIDDDTLMQLTWKMAAKAAGKEIIVFRNPVDFFKDAGSLDHAIPVYIDSNLGNGIKGEEVAKEIRKQGFSRIYLSTGYAPEDLGDLPWIDGIVGKDPIW